MSNSEEEIESLVFEKKGYPSIKIFENHFEVKAIDYWQYRTFKFSEIKDIKHYNPNDKWWNKLFIITSTIAKIFTEKDQWILEIKKKNGGEWEYYTSHISNSDFSNVLKLLKLKIDQ